MADIGSNTGCATDIVQTEAADVRVELKQKRQRLADTSTSAEDGDLGVTCGRRGERTSGERGRDGAEGGTGKHFLCLWRGRKGRGERRRR